jgi:SPX domain protein involved in polyphosphate accumulation
MRLPVSEEAEKYFKNNSEQDQSAAPTADKNRSIDQNENTINSQSNGPAVKYQPVIQNIGDKTLNRRYELKYLVSQPIATALDRYVTDFLPIDHYSKLHPDGFYPIVSLYMDSPELRLCNESMTGVLNRFKLRIRGYSEDPSYPKFFEVKRRANTVIIKSRSRVRTEDVAELIAGRYLPPAKDDPKDIQALKMYQLYMFSINAKPVVLIKYLRKAYEGTSDNRVRVTFDRELCYNVTSEPAVRLGGTGWQKSNVCLNGIIVEIKFTGRFPAWLVRMVELFNLKQRSMSKYASSLQNACLLKFCAPKIPILHQGHYL